MDDLEARLNHRAAPSGDDDIDALAGELAAVLTLLSDDELTMRVRLLQNISGARSWKWNGILARIDGLIAEAQFVFHFTRTAGTTAPKEALLALRQGVAWAREGVELLIGLDRHLREQPRGSGSGGLFGPSLS